MRLGKPNGNPSGGRPPKPASEKYQQYPLKLPPKIIKWLARKIENKNGFIVAAILEAIKEFEKGMEV